MFCLRRYNLVIKNLILKNVRRNLYHTRTVVGSTQNYPKGHKLLLSRTLDTSDLYMGSKNIFTFIYTCIT